MHYCTLTSAYGIGLVILAVTGPTVGSSAHVFGSERLEILRPMPYQVVQRQGFDPRRAHDHAPGGPVLGHALVTVEIDLSNSAQPRTDATLEYHVAALQDAVTPVVDWTAADARQHDKVWSAPVKVPAGGWYRLSVRARRGEEILAAGSIEPVGVGEVFLIAGQSYAAGANDELQQVDDPQGRVVAYDVGKGRWQIAHDPQPGVGDGGTIWPSMANDLLPLLRVPIGLVNVAVGGTSTRQWQPGEKLFEQLAAAGKTIGRFRALLWQQGESDVIEHRSTEYYVKNLQTMRDELSKIWGFDPPWLLAKSTLHPTVYKDPAGEGRIRAAIDQLWTMPGFRHGPDTDILAGENRGGIGTRRHFSGIGQRRAGRMWFAAIWQELNRTPEE